MGHLQGPSLESDAYSLNRGLLARAGWCASLVWLDHRRYRSRPEGCTLGFDARPFQGQRGDTP